MGDSRVDSLTEREREVVSHIARNRSEAQIATLLNISTHTVRTHIKNARAKAGGLDKYRLAEILAASEGRTSTIATAECGIANVPASEPTPLASTVEAVREEHAVFVRNEPAARHPPARARWGEDNDLRTLVIICLVLAIAVLIVQIVIHIDSLAGAFKEFAAHLHQID